MRAKQGLVEQRDDLADLVEMYEISLRAGGRSQKTIDFYLWTLRIFHDYLKERGDLPLNPVALTREHVETFLADVRATPSARTGRPRSEKSFLGIYNTLHIFFNWLVDRDEIPASPMMKMHAPAVKKAPPAVLDEDTLRRFLAHLRKGREFLDRRDYAMVVMYLDTGCRREEMVSADLDGIDWKDQTMRVLGKGNKERDVSFGDEAALVLRQYVRQRAQHMVEHQYRDSTDGPVWVSRLGERMTGSAVLNMLKRRAEECGLSTNVWTHLLRHTWAHLCLDAGMDTGDLKKLGGWDTDKMVNHYGSSEAARRAQKHHKQFSPGNRLLGRERNGKRKRDK